MKNQAILIIAYNRPNYLKILLDSLDCVLGIDNWDLYLSVDGSDMEAEFQQIEHMRSIQEIKWGTRVGISKHIIRSFVHLISNKYDRILYLEEDFIVRSDILLNWPEINADDTFFSMQSVSPVVCSHTLYSPLGNVITADKAMPLIEYYLSGKWHGKPWPTPVCPPVFLTPDMVDGYDAIFWTYLKDSNLKSMFRERSYVGHIGVNGTHFHNSDESNQLEAEIFTGDPSNWLENAATLFKKRLDWRGFVPKDFVYE